jgi:hypothetical protein
MLPRIGSGNVDLSISLGTLPWERVDVTAPTGCIPQPVLMWPQRKQHSPCQESNLDQASRYTTERLLIKQLTADALVGSPSYVLSKQFRIEPLNNEEL